MINHTKFTARDHDRAVNDGRTFMCTTCEARDADPGQNTQRLHNRAIGNRGACRGEGGRGGNGTANAHRTPPPQLLTSLSAPHISPATARRASPHASSPHAPETSRSVLNTFQWFSAGQGSSGQATGQGRAATASRGGGSSGKGECHAAAPKAPMYGNWCDSTAPLEALLPMLQLAAIEQWQVAPTHRHKRRATAALMTGS